MAGFTVKQRPVGKKKQTRIPCKSTHLQQPTSNMMKQRNLDILFYFSIPEAKYVKSGGFIWERSVNVILSAGLDVVSS